MDENIYQAPKSELHVETDESSNKFYIVSINKFTILFFATFGLYNVYWFYKNWLEYKKYTNTKSWPVMRGIFNIFFTHSLFSEVQKSLEESNKSFNWNPANLASVYVILSIVGHLLDKMASNEVGSPQTDILSVLFLPLIYFTLVKPQKAINLSQNDPDGSSNSNLTAGNYFWIVLGVIFWILVLFGLIVVLGIVDV
jgi:hypothetical protein